MRSADTVFWLKLNLLLPSWAMTLTAALLWSVRHISCLHCIDHRQAGACELISTVLELILTSPECTMKNNISCFYWHMISFRADSADLILQFHHLVGCRGPPQRPKHSLCMCVCRCHWGQVGYFNSVLCLISKQTHLSTFCINRLSVMWCLAWQLLTSCDYTDKIVLFPGCVLLF